MTLWKIDDAATSALMTRFYAHWKGENHEIGKALEEAQQDVRGMKGFESPYFWAGFVLVE